MSDSSVNVLIVDDRPEKLLSLEVVLEELGLNIVRAYNGREALRQVLKAEFAVILLDVNMPGMDGFETAELIRQRKNSADTPIIFLTAMGDDMHVARSYSLGAVDYLLTPALPQILRSKVAVFVDLFRKTQQVRLQAEGLRRRAAQLHQLTSASIEINSAKSVNQIAQVATDTARAIIGAHQAMILSKGPNYPTQATHYISYSSKYAASRNGSKIENSALLAFLSGVDKPTRMAQAELEAQVPPDGKGPPLRGLLAHPLARRDGRNLGIIILSDKLEGDFTDDDQAVLTQLAQMASVAIENTIFAAEREDNRLKEEFLSTLSHELRTPLNAMSGWIQLLRREPVDGEIGHGLEVIERNVQAQTKLIEDLLDLSRISTGKLRINSQPVFLHALLTAAIEAMRPAISEQKINLVCDLEDVNPRLDGDPDRLQQVFWNLLSNAAKFTPAGGTISVQMRSSGGQLKVMVRDTGEGIDREFLPHIFDRFRQADSSITRRHGGLGIGLTIVRHIIQLHGGTVTADSPGKGRGSTFTVTLCESIADRDQPAESARPAAADLPSLEGVVVLVVDDRSDAREIVSEIIRRQQAKVTTAGSAREAIGLVQSLKPDVLVTDLGMPEMDGYELLRELRRLGPEQGGQLPAIALTAYASAEDRHQVLEAGFQTHLAKPVDPRELTEAIHRASRGMVGAAADQAG